MLHQVENRLRGIKANDNKHADCSSGGTSCHRGVVGAGARRCGHGDTAADAGGGGRHESIPEKIKRVSHVRLPDDEQEEEEEEKYAGPSADGGGALSLEVDGVELVERAAAAAADGGGGGGSASTAHAAAAIPTAAVLEAGGAPTAAAGVRDGGGGGSGETSSVLDLV